MYFFWKKRAPKNDAPEHWNCLPILTHRISYNRWVVQWGSGTSHRVVRLQAKIRICGDRQDLRLYLLWRLWGCVCLQVKARQWRSRIGVLQIRCGLGLQGLLWKPELRRWKILSRLSKMRGTSTALALFPLMAQEPNWHWQQGQWGKAIFGQCDNRCHSTILEHRNGRCM